MRTQEEISERARDIYEDTNRFLNEGVETLYEVMDFDTAVGLGLAEGIRATREDWGTTVVETDEEVRARAKEYVEFAIGKIINHRGLSAVRSVYRLREYAWLLGMDETVTAMDEVNYGLYGAPMVRVFSDALELEWPPYFDLNNMAEGRPCRPDCDMGCLA